jgi:hypothetical protein
MLKEIRMMGRFSWWIMILILGGIVDDLKGNYGFDLFKDMTKIVELIQDSFNKNGNLRLLE